MLLTAPWRTQSYSGLWLITEIKESQNLAKALTFCMGAKNKCALAHPNHVRKLQTKFGWILSNSLGGDVTYNFEKRLTKRKDFIGRIFEKPVHKPYIPSGNSKI